MNAPQVLNNTDNEWSVHFWDRAEDRLEIVLWTTELDVRVRYNCTTHVANAILETEHNETQLNVTESDSANGPTLHITGHNVDIRLLVGDPTEYTDDYPGVC